MSADARAFSLAFRWRPGVSEACLPLQDGHGATVDMVLFAQPMRRRCARCWARLREGEHMKAGA